jgi:peptidoglycan/xylan/chitin deacetylase (PgdA/CDA1 family)
MISDGKVDHTSNLYQHKSTAEFTSDLDYLLSRYEPVGLSELMESINDGGVMRRPSFHLTFDDGFREMYDVAAPILQAKGIPATFFVNSAYTDNRAMCHEQKASIIVESVKAGLPANVGKAIKVALDKASVRIDDLVSDILAIRYPDRRLLDEIATIMGIDFEEFLAKQKPYLDSSQISDLIANGFTIGSHSLDHPEYGDISSEEQVYQTIESTRWVRETFGLDYGAFAFPYSDQNIGNEFFPGIRSSGLVDISFGTGGMIKGRLSRHLDRFSLEKPFLPAHKVINIQYAKQFHGGLKRSSK